MNDKIINIIEQIKTLSLLEGTELVKQLEDTFGVDISANFSAINANVLPTINTTQEIIEEKTSFDIFLSDVPKEKKIAVLKIIRNVTGLGLKESKDIVDNVPKLVKEGITKEESETIKKDLETAGAQVIIK